VSRASIAEPNVSGTTFPSRTALVSPAVISTRPAACASADAGAIRQALQSASVHVCSRVIMAKFLQPVI
jgi:hypothetical protein